MRGGRGCFGVRGCGGDREDDEGEELALLASFDTEDVTMWRRRVVLYVDCTVDGKDSTVPSP